MLPWLLRHTTIPLWALYERSPYLRVAARLESERALSLEARRERQLGLLQTMLAHAWNHVPFYQERLRACGFEPGDLRHLEDLDKLPVLSKQDVREHGPSMLSTAHSPGQLVRKATSGSTGKPLHVFVDPVCQQRRRGVLLYRDQWTGWRAGERRAVLSGRFESPTSLRSRLRNALVHRISHLDTLHLGDADLADFASRILRQRPTLLFGHAHSLYLLARFWETAGLPAYRFRAALATGMVLYPHERKTIARVFEVSVFDRYGSEELSLIATECEAHAGLHVNMDALIVEVVPDRPGDRDGRVIVTDLWNRGMPFIRYELGDRAILSPRSCPCGRTYPLVESVAGRIADHLLTPAGKRVSGIPLTEPFAALDPAVDQVQIVQDRLDHLLVRIVPGAGYGEGTRAAIAELVRTHFGSEMRHDVQPVAVIHQDPSGKYRFAICALDAGREETPHVGA